MAPRKGIHMDDMLAGLYFVFIIQFRLEIVTIKLSWV